MNPVASLKPSTVNLVTDLARKLAHENNTEHLTIPQHPARIVRLTATLRIKDSLVQHHKLAVLHGNNRRVTLAQVAVLQIKRPRHAHHNPTINMQKPLSLASTQRVRAQ
jgi:hypothetical protein